MENKIITVKWGEKGQVSDDPEMAKSLTKLVKKQEKRMLKPDIYTAALNLPHSEIRAFKKMVLAAGLQPYDQEEIDLRLQLANERWNNSICSNCKNKKPDVSLKKCSKCLLVFYCGPECQREHWKKKHKKECCNPDAPIDDLYSPVLLHPTKKIFLNSKDFEY